MKPEPALERQGLQHSSKPRAEGPDGSSNLARGVGPLSQVAVVSAVLSGDDLGTFEKIVQGSSGEFSASRGPREKRVRALMALQTRAGSQRGKGVKPSAVPSWARGRLPASMVTTCSTPPRLPPGAASAVDSAITASLGGHEPHLGFWSPPLLIINEN